MVIAEADLPEAEKQEKMHYPFRNKRTARGAAASILLLAVLVAASGCSRKSVEDYLKAGDQAMHENNLGNAQEDYEAAVKMAPNNVDAHLKLADFYMFEHNYPAAEVEYTKVATLDPGNAECHVALAKLYSARAQWSSAENQMRAAVALDPSSAEYRRQLALILNQRNRPGLAEAELRTAVGLAPGDAGLHLALAKFLATLPTEHTAADEEFARVRQLDPSLLESSTAPAEASSPLPAEESSAEPAGPPSRLPPVAPPASAGPSALPGPPASAAMVSPKPLKPLNKKFRLTHDSPVYQDPNGTSTVLAEVHHRRYVHVTGITGDWLQVTLRNGTVGFIPVTAAE
jgi:tetratricopeptide (TPR) repeat protein